MSERRRQMMSSEGGSDGRGFYRSYEYVDLGLPSGNLWATCNIGANDEVSLGNYYQFGRTSPVSTSTLGIYSLDISGTSYDVVYTTCGYGWRMPTKSDWEELINNTTFDPYYTLPDDPYQTYYAFKKTVGGVERYLILPKTNGYLSQSYLYTNRLENYDTDYSYYRAGDRRISGSTNYGPWVFKILPSDYDNTANISITYSNRSYYTSSGILVRGITNKIYT